MPGEVVKSQEVTKKVGKAGGGEFGSGRCVCGTIRGKQAEQDNR